MPVDLRPYLNTTWPEYDNDKQQYIDLSTDMSAASVKQQFNARGTAFWTKLVPEIVKDTYIRDVFPFVIIG